MVVHASASFKRAVLFRHFQLIFRGCYVNPGTVFYVKDFVGGMFLRGSTFGDFLRKFEAFLRKKYSVLCSDFECILRRLQADIPLP